MDLVPASDYLRVDSAVVVIANLVNLAMVAIFLVRAQGRLEVERRLGWLTVALALPLSVIVAHNALEGRSWWTIALPAVMVLFLLTELLLDELLKVEFRHTHLLGPYLLLYYLALMGMIGYAFQVSTVLGFVTLATYFAQLAATAYSYRRVGHGPRRQARA